MPQEIVSICGDGVNMTPAQSNAVICEKLTHLLPQFRCLLDMLQQFKDELSNGIVHWDQIVERVNKS